MGTAKESNRNRDEEEEEEIIPWKFVPNLIRQELIKKLNPNAAMSGNDWRMLACELGYTQWDINYIESDKDNNTKVLFSMYDKKPGASFNDVYKSLVNMQRQDCLDILNDAAIEIKQAYIRTRNSQMFHAAETSSGPITGGHYHWSNPPCPCTYSPHPAAACGSHSYGSCNHGFASCGCVGQTHPLSHCPYHGHPLPTLPQQPPCPADNPQKTCIQGLSSPRLLSPAHSHMLQEPLNCHDRNAHLSPTGYDSSTNRINTPVNQMFSHRGQSGLSPVHLGYRDTPAYSYHDSATPFSEKANGVVVDPDHSQLYQDLSLMQRHGGGLNNGVVISDVPAGLPDTLLREQVNNNNSTDSSSSENLSSRQKFTRQRSDSCSITPDSSRDKRFRYDVSSWGIVVNQQAAALPGTTFHDVNSTGKLRNSRSPKFVQHPSASNYVDHSDRFYQQEYKVKVENVQCSRDEKYTMNSPSYSNGSSWNRNHPSSTFPMRVKAKQDRAMEDLKDLAITKKSTSMPQNMKPKEYRKVFRHIKVFVTYSYDSEDHAKQVLSLCRFLQANGFVCCVDVSEKRTSVKSCDQLEWCMRKVAEADFILVCISNKYLDDIGSSRQTSSMSECRLHTREIYELMNNKHFNSQHNSFANNGSTDPQLCFIPLLFPDMTINQIPHWMTSAPIYSWPEQYKDLAWMLTKPQERIRTKRESQDEREL